MSFKFSVNFVYVDTQTLQRYKNGLYAFQAFE